MTPYESSAQSNPNIYSSFINPYLDGLSTLPSFLEELLQLNEENNVQPADQVDSSREGNKSYLVYFPNIYLNLQTMGPRMVPKVKRQVHRLQIHRISMVGTQYFT